MVADCAENDLLSGAGITVKLLAEVPVPAVFVTATVPVVPLPIVAIICVEVRELMAATAVPPMLTFAAVTPVKLFPLITIVLPAHADVDPKEVTLGIACTVVTLFIAVLPHKLVLKCTNKSLAEVVVTVTAPKPAPKTAPVLEPTLTVMKEVALSMVNLYLDPLLIPTIWAYSPS